MSSPRDGGSEIITYILQTTTDDEAGDWTTLLGTDDGDNDTVDTSYTHVDAGSEQLFYRIAARNEWGTGPFSRPNLSIDVAQAPDQISSVTVNDAGMVRITWFNPANGGGSNIESYDVEIMNSDGDFVAPADDCRPGTSDIKDSNDSASGDPISLCRIDMSKMQSEFGLAYNDDIVARVRAVNAAGLNGDWRESDDSAKVKTKPQQMPAAPVRGSSTDADTLHVTWDEVSTAEATGGSEIIYYSVYLNDDEDSIYQTSGTSYLYEQVDAAELSQKFRVAASNIYGTGEKSDLSLDIEFGSVPDKLTGLKAENVEQTQNAQATITWDDPAEDIDEYEFQILNKDENEYQDADNIMTGDAVTDFGVEFDCQELLDNYGYQAGDTITFRVRASNDVGASEWSYPTPANMIATSLSMLIL